MFTRELAQSLQKASRRQHGSHVSGNRFDDYCGNFRPVMFEHLLQRVAVVVRNGDCGVALLRLNAGTVGQTERRDARSGLDQQAVHVSVVASVELDDLGPVRKCARQADGAHGRFRA